MLNEQIGSLWAPFVKWMRVRTLDFKAVKRATGFNQTYGSIRVCVGGFRGLFPNYCTAR